MRGIKGTAKRVGDPCSTCRESLTLESSYPTVRRGVVGVMSRCRACRKKTEAVSRAANPNRRNEANKKNRDKIRDQVLDGYGRKCACCGETRWQFLAIDHVEGGGTKHRKTIRNPYAMRLLVIKEGFPAKYRLLCHNCNQAMGWHGVCPHETERHANP